MSEQTLTHKPTVRKKLTTSEIGRLGAIALNSDPEKKRAAALKAAQTRRAQNPDCFIEMGRLGGSTSKSGDKYTNREVTR